MKKLLFFTFLLCCINVFSQTPVENLKKLSETEPDKALSIWKEVYDRADEEGKVKSLLAVSQAYILKGDQKNFFSYFEKAEKESEKINDPVLKSEVLLHKSTLYAVIGLLDEAEKYAKQGIALTKEIGDTKKRNSIEGDISYMLLTIRTLNNKEKNPIPVYKKISDLYIESDLSKNEKHKKLSATYFNIATLYKKDNKIDSAKFYFEKIINTPNISENPLIEGLTYENLGEIEYQKNKLETAFEYLNKATPILKKNNDPNLSTNYALLSAIYGTKGDSKKELEYKKLENDFKSSLNANQKEAMKQVYTSLEKDRQEIEKKAEKRTVIIWIIVALSLFALVGLFVYLKGKKAKQKELYQQIISKLELQLIEKNTGTGIDFPKENQYQNSDKQPSQTDETVKPSFISDATEQELIKKLQKFEKSEKFTNKDLSISLLATQLGTNTKYLSEVISKHYSKNYNTYINDLRIDFICRKIATDPEYRKFKITYLAEACGFSSYNTFTTTFKNSTGMSPSSFLKEAILQD